MQPRRFIADAFRGEVRGDFRGVRVNRSVYDVRMARVNVSIPDDIIAEARAAGLNVSQVAAVALRDELERRAKVAALDRYLAALEAEFGPVPADERAAAEAWAAAAFDAPAAPAVSRRRRSA